MKDLKKLYKRRFGKKIEFRKELYKILCNDFYQQYIPKNAVLLEIGAGYCEFINTIKAKKKIAVDLNPDIKSFAKKDVQVILTSSTNLKKIKSSSIDVVYTSNLFEHIKKDDIIKTVSEIHRVLKKGGKILILQPNIRYCYKDYWMFFDHITPLDDRSVVEILEINNFRIVENRPKFLPYTTISRLPKSGLLLKIYLRIPLLQKIFGKQAFIYAIKNV
ncbi:class I SAM-dependent methyltransferase [Candidatus Woesearchaeota archaeon]|nr:class I SAM-dependent methyltransferase [Candidatus Woesearchaeota archaeon]